MTGPVKCNGAKYKLQVLLQIRENLCNALLVHVYGSDSSRGSATFLHLFLALVILMYI